MSDYPGRTFKTDHVSLGASFVDILSSHKKVERAVIFVLLISEWHGVIVVISNAKCKHVPLTFLWRRQRICALRFQAYNFHSLENCFFSLWLYDAMVLSFVLVTCLLRFLIVWLTFFIQLSLSLTVLQLNLLCRSLHFENKLV